MQLWQALLIGALQGVSELFPVSSLAHTILIPALLMWNINQNGGDFLAFVVALHLATAIALLIYFWRDWRDVLMAFVGSIRLRQLVYDSKSKFAWLLVAGTVLVGIFGLLFEKKLRELFDDPSRAWIVAVLLIVNGFIMLFGEFLRKRSAQTTQPQPQLQPVGVAAGYNQAAVEPGGQQIQLKEAEQLTFPEATGIGGSQILALFPGISRSGVTMIGGLLAGLSHEAAARFSFMLATPVIGLAALLKVPDLFKPDARGMLGTTVLASLIAGVTAYISIRFLMRYFETKRLSPFGYYCMLAGALSLIVFLSR